MTLKKLHPQATILCYATLAGLACLPGCADSTTKKQMPVYTATEISSPAGSPSGESNLTVGADGAIYLSWISGEPDSGYTLYMSRREGDGWGSEAPVSSGENWFVNWADFPALAVNKSGAALNSWLEKSSGETFSYDVKLALADSVTGVRGAAFSPHNDSTKTEHGFVSLTPLPDGSFGAVWLDGRQFVVKGPMSVRFCEITRSGEIRSEALLDSRVCDCCQTSLIRTAHGTLICAYRDRSDVEIRDIAITRRIDGQWTEPKVIHDDNWYTPGCPVNGPALAASDSAVAIAWFTRDSVSGAVYVAFSKDEGESFHEPIRVDSGNPEGRVDITFVKSHTALVSWLELKGDSAALCIRAVGEDGEVGDVSIVAYTSASRASGFAHLASGEGETLVSWTDTEGAGRVRVARIQ